MAIVEKCQAGKKSSVPKFLKQIFSALKIYPNEKTSKHQVSEKGEDHSDCDRFSTESQSALLHLGNFSHAILNSKMCPIPSFFPGLFNLFFIYCFYLFFFFFVETVVRDRFVIRGIKQIFFFQILSRRRKCSTSQ